jgi:hypothetical protein
MGTRASFTAMLRAPPLLTSLTTCNPTPMPYIHALLYHICCDCVNLEKKEH